MSLSKTFVMKIIVWLLVFWAGVAYVRCQSNRNKNHKIGRQRMDICKVVCNNYEGICLPAWLDPWNLFVPHCEDNGGKGRPETGCILCLKSHAITAKTTLPTTTPTTTTPTTTTPTTTLTTTTPTTSSLTTPKHIFDPCDKVCNHYVGVCLPNWLDIKKVFSPHCEDVDNTASKPKYQCISCIKVNGAFPNPTRTVTSPKSTAPDSSDVTAGCVKTCKCVRIIRLSITVKSWTCPLPGETVPPCDSTDPTAMSDETEESQCVCGCDFDHLTAGDTRGRKSGNRTRVVG